MHHSYYNLGEKFYSKEQAEKLNNPQLICFNHQLAREINFNSKDYALEKIFSGQELLPGSIPIALAYAGHQFGHFVPQLGDGRALLLGEIKDKKSNLLDIGLKGSGRTYFSRNGDGKCPLDSAIREYLVSEAMHKLKIATTRSLALIKTDDLVQRENIMPASVITRIAKSHIRVGSFEYFAARNDQESLKALADYAIKRHFPQIDKEKNKYLKLLKFVIKKQAELVASWLSVGFIHGVMNTDNTTISGQTIDYGPCAFMDEYNSHKKFSYIDKMGRYSYINQRKIILWNLARFAETLLELIEQDTQQAIKMAEKELYKFPALFDKIYYQKMAKKVGIFNFKNNKQDKELISSYLQILEENKSDFTLSFRNLSKLLRKEISHPIQNQKYLNWHKNWLIRLAEQKMSKDEIAKKMNKHNPILIPRNHIISKIIKQAIADNNYSEFNNFLAAIKQPFTQQKKYANYYLPPSKEEEIKYTYCGT